MKSNFSRFLHHTMSYLGGKPDTASSLSYSDLIGVSRSNQVANLSHLDYRVKPDNDSEGADYRVKPDNDSVCAGRSMVEMLGVLAIIGVLSVGAIAGYSKAMMKYKLNKQAEQISWLLNVMYRYKSEFGRNPQRINLTSYFIKLGEIPENMIAADTSLHDVFNSKILLRTNGCDNNECNETLLEYIIYSPESFEVCQNLLNIAKEFNEQLRFIWISKTENGTLSYGNQYIGSRYCTNGTKCLKDITQEQIYGQCNFCAKESSNCSFYFIFKISD